MAADYTDNHSTWDGKSQEGYDEQNEYLSGLLIHGM
jgi:hypothetical protein